MELKDDEFRALSLKVDQISSELDKQNTVRVVNTKWMLIVGAVIVSALGFTSLYKLPQEANRAVEEKVGENIMSIAKGLITISKDVKGQDFVNLPVGTIIPSMLNPGEFAKVVLDSVPFKDDSKEPNVDPTKPKWVLADGRDVKGSKYDDEDTDRDAVPDLRGVFLRGIDVDGVKDPAGKKREAGDYQKDALQDHVHDTNATAKGDSKIGQGYTRNKGGLGDYATVKAVKDANAAVETRPKNVAVYFYIKIN